MLRVKKRKKSNPTYLSIVGPKNNLLLNMLTMYEKDKRLRRK